MKNTKRLKITFTKKLRTDYIWGMPAITHIRIFHLPTFVTAVTILKINNFNFTISYTCGEMSSLITREEHRLRVSENKVLRRITGPKRKNISR